MLGNKLREELAMVASVRHSNNYGDVRLLRENRDVAMVRVRKDVTLLRENRDVDIVRVRKDVRY